MTNVDSQRIREIRDNTKAMAEAFGRIADTLAEALELFIATKTETQNSNLTFEKADERCKGCNHYKLTCDLFSEICEYEPKDECIECHYEPKDECAKEYEELGLKELKELIEADRKTESNSEKPNNCEHITEDGVTCAKYPACDDCLDNPLNKVKGSERLVKGSEQTDCQTCKWGEWYRQGYDITMMDDECGGCCSWNSKWTPKTEPTISKMEQVDKDINVRSKESE